MTSKRQGGGGRRRANIYELEPPPSLPEATDREEFRAAVRSIFASRRLDARAARAQARLDMLHREAIEVYRAYGLPTQLRAYDVAEVAQTVSRKQGPEGQLNRLGSARRLPSEVPLELLGEAIFGRDHEAAFAGLMLETIGDLQALLFQAMDEKSTLALEMFETAIALADARNMHLVEFVLGDTIASGKAAKFSATRAAAMSAKARQDKAEREWKSPARAAMIAFRESHPHASQDEVASEVGFAWKGENAPPHVRLLRFLQAEERAGRVPKRTPRQRR